MLRRFASPRWLALHALALAMVAVFVRLGWWQLRRAGQGNALSWGYAVEWPVFAAFTVFVWYRIMRDSVQAPPPATREPATFRVPTLPARPAAAGEPDDDAELRAYNQYLKSLHER